MSAVRSASTAASSRMAAALPRSLAGNGDAPLALVRDPLRLALFVLTVLTISRVHQHYPVLEKFRPALLLVVAAVGYAYLHPRYLTRKNVFRLWPMRLVGALGALACCSAAVGISLGGSASFILGSYAKTLTYALLIAVSIRHVRDLYTFVWAYVISCSILSFFSLFVFGISKSGSYVTRLNNLYTYDSNDLGVVMLVGLPLTLLLLTIERGSKRWFLLATLIGIAATMARSGSRGGFLGFVAVGMAALILVQGVSASKRLLVVLATFSVLAIGAPPGYWMQMATILSPKKDYNYTDVDGRKAVMDRGIGYMMLYPAFGLGIDNFARAECTISPKLASHRFGGPLRCTPPHNSYLQAGAELGIPGLIVWVMLVFGGVLAPLRLRRRLPKSWRRGNQSERLIYGATSFFPVAMVGFAVPAFFVTFAWMDTIYFLAALLTGLYVAAQAQVEGSALGTTAESPQGVPPGKVSGWRVRQSAWRSLTRAEGAPAH